MIYPAEEAERRRKEAQKALASILLLYSLGEMSREDALAAATKILEGYQKIVIQEVNDFYESKGLAGTLQPSDERLKANLDALKTEFMKALDAPAGAPPTEAEQGRLAEVFAIYLVFSVLAIITENVALVSEALLRWVSLLPDPDVCAICEELHGQVFDPRGPLPGTPGEIHWGCRCRWEIVFREAA